jgi:hypothetical protein
MSLKKIILFFYKFCNKILKNNVKSKRLVKRRDYHFIVKKTL